MKIIDKYVLREHLGPLLFSLSALTSLLLLNYIAKRFGALVGKGLEWTVIGEFFLLSIPFTIAMTIPMAVLVSTLHAFSRLAAENEATAFKASGVSMRRLLLPVLVAASVLAVGMIVFNDQFLPRANHRLAVLQSDILRKKPTFALREQVTNRVTDRLWLRAGRINPGSGELRDVVIYDFSDPERPRTVYADSGRLAITPDQADLALELHHGVVREFPRSGPGAMANDGSAGSPTFQQTFFVRDRVLVRGVGNQLQRSEDGGAQVKSDREQTVCELQQSYTRFAREYADAHDDLVALATRAIDRGQQVEIPPRRTTYVKSGLGALYCRLVGSLGVPAAFASDPQDPPPTERPVPPGATPQGATPQGATPLPAPQPVPQKAAESLIPDSIGGTMPGDPPGPSIVVPEKPVPAGVAGPELDSIPRRGARPGPVVNSAPTVMLDAARLRVSANWEQLNRFDVEIQKKFALAVACVVFVLLGAPVALRFPRGGVGMTIGVSLFVFALYYVGLIAGETVADKGYLPPWAAMWAANILFTVAGLVLLARMGREEASGRGGGLNELWDAIGRAVTGRRRGAALRAERGGSLS